MKPIMSLKVFEWWWHQLGSNDIHRLNVEQY